MKWIGAAMIAMLALASVGAGPVSAAAEAAGGQDQNDAARALLTVGRDLLDEGKYAEAEKKLHEALTKYPKSDQADRTAYYRITALAKLGRVPEALAEIDGFSKSYPVSKWLPDVQEKRIGLTNQVPADLKGRFIAAPLPSTTTLIVRPPAQAQQLPGAAAPAVIPPGYTTFRYNVGPGVQVNRWNADGIFLNGVWTDSEVSLQQEILRVVLKNDPEQGIEIAKARLKADPADPVVISNFSAIAETNSPNALPLMASIAKTSTSQKTRGDAIFWIGRSDNPKRLAMLEEMYKASPDNIEVRRAIASAVSQMTGLEAVKLLADMVRNDTDAVVRRTAVQSLSTRKEPEAIKALGDYLQPGTRGAK